MPKVSHHQLPPHVYQKLFTLLPVIINIAGSAGQADSFVNTIFSTSEKTMIAKRLAIILMLTKGKTYAQISAKLKVSHSTIGKMAELVAGSNQQFLHQFERIAKSDAASDFWNALGYKLETLLPPKGANWSEWQTRKLKEKTAAEQPF